MVFREMRKNIFVFVVCGEDEHINTLNYSLSNLKHFSDYEILIVTDPERNSLQIDHDNILNVSTPQEFDHHQASIYLKVGLHKFLDMGQNYCYLDSDVVAVNHKVNEIFSQFESPIVFAKDHCSIEQFSPNAINCDCIQDRNERVNRLQKLEEEQLVLFKQVDDAFQREWKKFVDKYGFTDKQLLAKYNEVIGICESFGKEFNSFTNRPFLVFLLSHLNEDKYNFERVLQNSGKFRWDRKQRKIFDNEGNLIFDDHDKFDYDRFDYDAVNYYSYIADRTGYEWREDQNSWFENGKNAYIAQCNHLKESIREKFDVLVGDDGWQHWNGGVFLFNSESVDFMDKWFDKTMAIFKDDKWKTRDQGTLIATVWEMGLQDAVTLPSEFNFLADRKNLHLKFDVSKGFSFDDFVTSIIPSFIHVYHDFGASGWDVWDFIDSAKQANQIEEAVT